ncbi:MAG: monovalent cation/H(+) antiporter subunit G [Myxococcales bacterium FL481]|nr:MAG: monovalent cation/H(+) antiporter subunit G [Myxococcales bacterium FL481]
MAPLDIASAVLLALGCLFALTGAVGIVRMPDFYTRLHPAGKSDSFAQALIIAGLMLQTSDPLIIAKLALISALLFVTSPTATHAITKAAHLDGLRPIEDDGESR